MHYSTLLAFLLFISCAKQDNISKPVVLGDFRIYAESGREIKLKSSSISADANSVGIVERNQIKDFTVNGIKYFVFDVSHYEGGSHTIVNAKTGKIHYIADFDSAIVTKKDKVFLITVGCESYCEKMALSVMSLENDVIKEECNIDGLFGNPQNVILHDDGSFEFMVKQFDFNDSYATIIIEYRSGKFNVSHSSYRQL